MKKGIIFQRKIVIFIAKKNCCILHGCVFVMVKTEQKSLSVGILPEDC